MKKKKAPTLKDVMRRLDEVESVVWALHRAFHNCEKWRCVEWAKALSKTKGV